jgi:hypothetical protein
VKIENWKVQNGNCSRVRNEFEVFNREFKFEVQVPENNWLAFSLELLYRKAVGSQSPGLPLRLLWVTELISQFNCNAVASEGRNPFRVGIRLHLFPGLKQPWALRNNRFAVPVPLVLSTRVARQT